MKFKIISLWDAEEEIYPEIDHIIISITDPDMPDALIQPNKHCLGILRQKFDDCEREYTTFLGKEMVRMSDSQAEELIAFFNQHKNAHIAYIHCVAGICRSSAIAAAFHVFLGQNNEWIFKSSEYDPNKYIYDTLVSKILKQK